MKYLCSHTLNIKKNLLRDLGNLTDRDDHASRSFNSSCFKTPTIFKMVTEILPSFLLIFFPKENAILCSCLTLNCAFHLQLWSYDLFYSSLLTYTFSMDYYIVLFCKMTQKDSIFFSFEMDQSSAAAIIPSHYI